jgi:hypothetical protein
MTKHSKNKNLNVSKGIGNFWVGGGGTLLKMEKKNHNQMVIRGMKANP